ncbi:MAG: hypothetical protein ABW133_24965, partial [Polyangiaceae bacterium]
EAPSTDLTGGRPPRGTPPTDLELMLWVDGELLDAERAGEIAELVRSDARVRAVVTALRQASQAVSEDALRHAELSDADGIADNVMEAIVAAESRRLIAPVKRGPAWRGPAVVAIGIVFAAAAAWTIIFPRELSSVARRSTSGGVGEPTLVEDDKTGVSIDVVDFGGRPGTIFYVPSEDESILPVVWLTEDDTPSTDDEPPPSLNESSEDTP